MLQMCDMEADPVVGAHRVLVAARTANVLKAYARTLTAARYLEAVRVAGARLKLVVVTLRPRHP